MFRIFLSILQTPSCTSTLLAVAVMCAGGFPSSGATVWAYSSLLEEMDILHNARVFSNSGLGGGVPSWLLERPGWSQVILRYPCPSLNMAPDPQLLLNIQDCFKFGEGENGEILCAIGWKVFCSHSPQGFWVYTSEKQIEDVGGEKVRDTEEKIKFCLNRTQI